MFKSKRQVMGLLGVVGLLLLVLVLACAALEEKEVTPIPTESAERLKVDEYATGRVLQLGQVPFEPEGRAGAEMLRGSASQILTRQLGSFRLPFSGMMGRIATALRARCSLLRSACST